MYSTDGRTDRASADAARVVVIAGAGVEDVVAFDEKRPSFAEGGFEHRQIHLRGIRLDLPEVRVDGRLERQVRADADFHVGADLPAEVQPCCRTGCSDRDRHSSATSSRRMRQEFEPLPSVRPLRCPRRSPNREAQPRFGPTDDDPVVLFVELRPPSFDVESPHALGLHR